MNNQELIHEINRLKKEKIILHNYQRAEVQDIADSVETFELSRKLPRPKQIYSFCGVIYG